MSTAPARRATLCWSLSTSPERSSTVASRSLLLSKVICFFGASQAIRVLSGVGRESGHPQERGDLLLCDEPMWARAGVDILGTS